MSLVETHRARHALQFDVTDLGERHRRPFGRFDHFLADENFSLALRSPRSARQHSPCGRSSRPGLDDDRPRLDSDVGGGRACISIASLMSRAATRLLAPGSGK